MAKQISLRSFMRLLFDDEHTAGRAAEIGQAILIARSTRLTEVVAQ